MCVYSKSFVVNVLCGVLFGVCEKSKDKIFFTIKMRYVNNQRVMELNIFL